MPFFDVHSYKQYLRRQILDSTTLVFALAFDPSGAFLVAGTITGLLKVFSLASIASAFASIPAQQSKAFVSRDLSQYGSINAISVTKANLFVATDKGLLCFDWDMIVAPLLGKPTKLQSPTVAFPQVKVVAITVLGKDEDTPYVIAATREGVFAQIHLGGTSIGQLGNGIKRSAYPHCLTGTYEDPHMFLAGCNDGFVRQFDVRVSTPVVHQFSLMRAPSDHLKPYISSVALTGDATFAMVADSDRSITSLHLPTGSTIASKKVPFSPQAVVFANGQFYCGGSDMVNANPGLPLGDKCIRRCDIQCRSIDRVPCSVSSVYAMAVSSAGAIAAGGYSTPKFSDVIDLSERADVYIRPPVRSFSVTI